MSAQSSALNKSAGRSALRERVGALRSLVSAQSSAPLLGALTRGSVSALRNWGYAPSMHSHANSALKCTKRGVHLHLHRGNKVCRSGVQEGVH